MTKSSQIASCPECGGQFTAEETCTERYHACMELELTNPDYGAVHHLTVPAYMLQHPRQLSAEGWQAMRQILHQFLVDRISPARMRQLLQPQMQNKSFSIVQGEPAAEPAWVWRKTIMDVRLDDPPNYCAEVRAWAEAVHHDLQQGLKQIG